MLECAALLISHWRGIGAGIVRSISNPATGAPLGVVRRLALGRWWPWPRQGLLHVLETEDEALLLSMEGPTWLGAWHFFDAEERCLGRLKRTLTLVNAMGEPIAQMRRAGPRVRFVNPAGLELACHQPVSAHVWDLHFSAERATSPFTRMLLLGAVIAVLEGAS